MGGVLSHTHSDGRIRCVSALAQNSLACCGGQRLGARYDAIPAVDGAPPAGEGGQVRVRSGVDSFGVQRHVDLECGCRAEGRVPLVDPL